MASLLPAVWDLPEIFHQRLGHQVGRPRAMVHEGHLLLVLHEVPETGVPERTGIFFWRDPAGEWRTSAQGNGKTGLRDLVKRYATRVDELEAEYAAAENAKQLFPVLRATTPLVRAAKHLHQVLQRAREACGPGPGGKAPGGGEPDKDIIDLRDRAGEVEHAADLLTAEAQNALEFDIAEAAQEQAKLNQQLAVTGQRLNMLAAVFLPMTAVASVFGMNLESGLEHAAKPVLFWVTLVLGILVGLLVRSMLAPSRVDEDPE